MFIVSYKSTLKNIFRSKSFWLILAIVLIVAIQSALTGFHSVYDKELRESISDTDPRYILEYRIYIQWLNNSATLLLHYIIPIFAIVTTALILNRDYGDNFFEIEKSIGIKVSHYIFGRIGAALTLICTVSCVANFLSAHLYVFARGGVNGMNLSNYIIDSTVRLLRIDVLRIVPCAMFYICLTYMIGALFKNKILAVVSSVVYVIVYYANTFFNVFKNGVFLNYVSHNPVKLRRYLHYYDTEWFADTIEMLDTSVIDVIICIGILVGFSIMFLCSAFFAICRRDI